jgi:hypothetical protein
MKMIRIIVGQAWRLATRAPNTAGSWWQAEGSGSRIEVDYGDEENENESLGGNDDFENDAHGMVDFETYKYVDWCLDGVDNSMADPYANVFFSKDRTEVIIEPLPDRQAVDEINILSRVEWMRGCPEGSESKCSHHLIRLISQTSKVICFNITTI